MIDAFLLHPTLTAGLVAGGATTVGSLGAFWVREVSARTTASVLAVAGGMMLAAALLALIAPAWALTGGALGVPLAAALGAGALAAADRLLPMERWAEGAAESRVAIWIVLAMALHNFPEGMAIGMAFHAPASGQGLSLLSGVVMQDLPEGLLTALALMTAHYRRVQVLSLVAVTGLAEVAGALCGSWLITRSGGALPWAMAAAGGAMLWVVARELIPESVRALGGRAGVRWTLAGAGAGALLSAVVG